ncbi:MAG: tetratricopeptide repeat protein [Patescibacteria group bacterium]|jgi:tetratricopeptide (TPR) repeat protein
MWLTILLTVLIVAALGVLIYLMWKKWPQLRMIDPAAAPGSKTRELKGDLIRQRVERASFEKLMGVWRTYLRPALSATQNGIRRLAGRLTAAERRYQERMKKDRGEKPTTTAMRQMIEESEKLMDEELWDRAEKILIEVISADPKHVSAYEHLGWLYLRKKEYDLARETFTFLRKLAPTDASVIASLGEVEELQNHPREAYEAYKQAVDLSPKNPKYLDFFIGAAIAVGEKHEAMSAVDRLRAVNPENQKIEEFEAQIAELPGIAKKEEIAE